VAVKPKSKEAESDASEDRTMDQQLSTIFTPAPIQLHRLTVEKTSAVKDFGFSLSDGMYEKGVYVSAVRSGSPAQLAGVKSFDRILQVWLFSSERYLVSQNCADVRLFFLSVT
jgi:C-terminal processing protease CtpA/Prc